MRNLQELNSIHSGLPAFIIGAGPSLATENLESLRNNKNCVTLAVNSGIVAFPQANYFVSDDQEIFRWNFFYETLRNDSQTKVLLYEDKLKNVADWFGDRAYLFRHRKGIHVPDYYDHEDKKTYIGETRTSLGSCIMIAHLMKCSPIILLGVDCCRHEGKRYFWQLHGFTPPVRNDGMPVDKFKKCKVKHKVSDTDLLDISRSWQALGIALLQKCKVFNGSSMSILNVFSKVDWRKYAK